MGEALAAAQQALDATVRGCAGQLSFEERAAQRQAEIKSLEEGLEVLRNSGV